MDKNPVNIKIENISLKKAVFDLQKCEENKEYKILFLDEIETRILNDTTFTLTFIRKTADDSPFKLVISYGATIKAIRSDLNANNESIGEFADRKKEEIARKLFFPSRASVLISEITRESGSALVTVPTIILRKIEKGERVDGNKKN